MRRPEHDGTMPASDRGKGQQRCQDMILLLLVLTAGLAGQVYSDYEEGEPPTDAETALHEEIDDVVPTLDTALTTLNPPGDGAMVTTEENGLSGEGELYPTDIAEHIHPILLAEDGSGDGSDPEEPATESVPNFMLIAIPLVLLLLLAAVAAAFVISRRRAKKRGGSGDLREDDILNGCDEEKIPMPMFEDDVPSVLELEMEDLEKWMIKDSGGICSDSRNED
ncbi:hypothetical protein AAFF_G00317360 [Aldrovandia affinis]|uniref:Transmembrane protein 154 n=1 Tax=Aldrovandia affinis TaxID=143900 RepID=A0AAD7R9P7_9TELE|nr:hypothetical protein AAFF_G00317360 [Aldrovandia affinis]